MSEGHDRNYRPKSPDLSGFKPPRLNRVPSYHPDPAFSPGYPVSARGSYDASPFFSPQTTTPSTSYFGARSQASFAPQAHSPQAFRTTNLPTQASPPSHSQPLPQAYNIPPLAYSSHTQSHSTFAPNYITQQPSQQPPPHSGPLDPFGDMARTRQKKAAEESDADYDPNLVPTAMLIKAEQHPSQSLIPVAATDLAHEIEVRTKFPVARIKRIMQADEDVGKVAQATPTAVSKALELFMISLVAKGAVEARANNSKRVTAQHLKTALMKDGKFDFLTEICENVPDEGSKKGRAKSEAKSEDSEDEMVAPKKKAKGGRKRKAGTDDDTD